MVVLGAIRHGKTDWNERGLVQGRTDRPLSEAGREEVQGWRLPAPWQGDVDWVSSPLTRAVTTATLLRGRAPRLEPALIEADWGAWEGYDLDTLRRTRPGFEVEEARGLDFRPPGGESPRDVLARVSAWLASLPERGPPIMAVTHNGVLRALLVAATGWPMLGKPPVRLHREALHVFHVGAGGSVRLARPNIPLTGSAPSTA